MLNALLDNNHSELVEITHPYHPLRGQKFFILKRKRWGDREILSLHSDRGLTVVPKAWTSLADPKPDRGLILDGQKMLEMVELVAAIEENSKKGVGK